VPIEVPPDRGVTLAMKWIIGVCRARKGKSFDRLLAEELIAASNGSGEAIKKKEDLYRMAEANRAFAHFAR